MFDEHLEVDLGRRERAAELVVDLAGEARLFVLLQPLQVVRQRGDLRGALEHFSREAVAALGRLYGLAAAAAGVLAQQHAAERHEEQVEPDDEEEAPADEP